MESPEKLYYYYRNFRTSSDDEDYEPIRKLRPIIIGTLKITSSDNENYELSGYRLCSSVPHSLGQLLSPLLAPSRGGGGRRAVRRSALVPKNFAKFFRFSVTSNL